METNNQNLPASASLPPQQSKKWYQHKGFIAVAILAVVAAGVSYVALNKKDNKVCLAIAYGEYKNPATGETKTFGGCDMPPAGWVKVVQTDKLDNIAQDSNYAFIFYDDSGNVLEADLRGKKNRITTLPFALPIENLDQFFSKDKNISIWVHRRFVPGESFEGPELGQREAYTYNRANDSWKQFGPLITSETNTEIEPLQLSPNGDSLIVLDKFSNGRIALSMIDLKTETKQILIDNFQRKQNITGGSDKELTFWRWLGDSTNFYYTQKDSEKNGVNWESHSVLYKFNVLSKKSELVLDGDSICKSSSLIPSASNENIIIAPCSAIYVYDQTDGESKVIFEQGFYPLEVAGVHINSVTPDGKKFIYFSLTKKEFYVMHLDTKIQRKIDLKASFHPDIYFSPDSSTILYKGQNIPTPKSGIFIYDFTTDQAKQILSDENLAIIGF